MTVLDLSLSAPRSLGGGEIALSWWFEECLTPYLKDTSMLEPIHTISIVTGYGKTRTRGRRQGNDGMKKRVQAMLSFMGVQEMPEDNAGRVRVDKVALVQLAHQCNGIIQFDLEGYTAWKDRETTANQVPDVPQKIRARFKPVNPGSGGPPFTRIETEHTSPEYLLEHQKETAAQMAEDEKALLASPPRREEYQGRDRDGPYGGRGRFGGRGRGGRGSPRWGGRGDGGRSSYDRGSSGFGGGNRGGYNDDNSRFERQQGGQQDHYGRGGGGDSYYGPSSGEFGGGGRGSGGPRRGSFGDQSRYSNDNAPYGSGDGGNGSRGDYQEPVGNRKRGYDDVSSPPQNNDTGRGYSIDNANKRRAH